MKYVIYEKLSEKSKESDYGKFMHVRATYGYCLGQIKGIAFK